MSLEEVMVDMRALLGPPTLVCVRPHLLTPARRKPAVRP